MAGRLRNDTITVELGPRSYRVHIGGGLLDEVGERLRRLTLTRRCVVVTQETPGGYYADRLLDSLRRAGFEAFPVLIPEGEQAKTLRQAKRLYDVFLRSGLDRWSPVVALGGGVTGDLTGFAAGTFMRGIPFIQVPTTLVAQVDSSVGGKVAVNHPRAKNIIGLFHQPRAVFIDPETLRTLPRRDLVAGLAEVIRYACIADARFFRFLEEHISELKAGRLPSLQSAIRRCVAIKADIVRRDETEQKDIRALLNYGHTLGHAVEAATGYERFRHGEAVAIGMAAAARISFRAGIAPRRVMERQISLLKKAGLPFTLRGISPEKIVNSLKLDKKVREGKMRFVLTEAIGHATVTNGLEAAFLVGELSDRQGRTVRPPMNALKRGKP